LFSPGIALTCSDVGRLIDLSSFFRTDLSFSSASGRGTPIRIWPTAIIGLEPAAVTEYQR
jgi:hypothetical protein